MSRRRRFVVWFFVLICAAVLADAPHVAADSVVATVAVGTTPQQVQLNPSGTKLFVSNEVSNSVSVISTASNTVLATISVGLNPGPIRFTPDGAKAYVVNEDSDDVSVINVATHVVTATIPVGDRPVTLSRTNDGTKVYVANELSNNVSVVSTATDTVIDTVAVGSAPHTMAKTPDGTKLYVANEGSASNNVSVISTASNAVLATISVLPSRDPGSIHFLPNGTKAYVANRGCAGITCVPAEVDPTVSVINVATNSVSQTIDVGAPGDAPHAMRITPDGAKLYVVNKHGDEVVVISTATNAILTNLQLQNGSCSNIAFGAGSCPVRVELAPDGSRAFVLEERPLAANGFLTAICTGVVPSVCGGASIDTVGPSVPVGGSPVDLEMSGSNKAYVSNSTSNSVTVVAIVPPVPAPGDSDGDGCSDAAEQQTAIGSEATGGRRSFKNPWDFYDTDGNKSIDLFNDIFGVAFAFGLTPNDGGYSTAFDRSAPAMGMDVWDMQAPDGTIDLFTDIFGVAFQFGHNCS